MWRSSSVLGLASIVAAVAMGQPAEETTLPSAAVLDVEPLALTLEVGEQTKLSFSVRDGAGDVIDKPVVFYSRSRQSVSVSAAGDVEALRPGEHVLVALVPKDPDAEPRRAEPLLKQEIEVSVPLPPISELRFETLPEQVFVGTRVRVGVVALDTLGEGRHDVAVDYSVSDPSLASIDRFGDLNLLAPGAFSVVAATEGAEASLELVSLPNPIESLELRASAGEARTGDVVRFSAIALDRDGRRVDGAPVHFAVSGEVNPAIVAPGAAGSIDQDGLFVAERSGVYRVFASTGSHSAMAVVEITSRDVQRDFKVVGHAPVRDRHTSDHWVWEASDGRDYAITGTWGAGGHAYIWDVTNPEAMVVVDTVHVDARTVNDVKVSADGRLAIISREGASDRKNGIVFLDVSEPKVGVRVLGSYDDQLNGGVHNLFIYEEHVYAVNNGRRFDVINIEDPAAPIRVGRFELDRPGPAIHDIWITEGVAFTSNWKDGVVAIDVGGAGMGGSPSRPKMLGRYAYPSGWNHSAYPYRSPSTGKFYVFAGDEAFPYSKLRTERDSVPMRAAGWVHVIEWDDWNSPREVARYQVPEAGTHNLWVEDEVLYAACYNGGLRAVDISGELRGDLYRQGREIAFWLPLDGEGYIPNAAFTWGPQPFKGNIFVTDWNSGLWAVKLEPKTGSPRVIGEPR